MGYQKFILALCCLSSAAAYSQQKGFVIKGTITGKDTGTVYLVQATERKIVDSVLLKDGRFVFTGKLSSPQLYTIKISGVKTTGNLFVENGMLEFKASADSLSAAKVTGSSTDLAFREFWKRFVRLNRAGAPANRRLNEWYNKTKPNTPERAAVEDSFKVLTGSFTTMMEDFIRENAGSPVAAYVINDRFIGFGSIEEAKKMYAVLQPQAAHSYYGAKVKAALGIAAKSDIGVKVKFSQPDTSGKKVRLSDLKAKYILVDFWASWCGPCRKENPNLVNAYNKYHSKGFDIIGVSLDDKKASWLKAIEQDGLTWTHVSDLKGWKNDIAVDYGINVVPTSFLIDKEGKIMAKNLRGEALERKLSELLD